MKRKLVYSCVALMLGTGAGYASLVFAQAKPQVLVKQRQAAMTLISKYFGPLNGMAQGKIAYNADIVKRNAGYLQALSQMPWDGFHANTKDQKSRALPAVYDDAAKFKSAQERFTGAVAKLSGADEGSLKAVVGEIGKACGACHDDFRSK